MAYRYDDDLKFLKNLKSKDLDDLVYCLIHDTDGTVRFTEELTISDEYKNFNPDHHQYWKLIAAEIQCFGANTFASLFRGGRGVLYREVLTDVCDKLNVKYNHNADTETIEKAVILKILEDAVTEISYSEMKDIAADLGIIDSYQTITPQLLLGSFQTIFKLGGFKSYQLSLIVVNSVMRMLFGRGLALASNAALTKTLTVLTGPIGWVITSIWTALDIAGPAYRVTIPAVIHVAVLRQKFEYERHNIKLLN